MDRNTSKAQRPHVLVHNSTGYTPEVHDVAASFLLITYVILLL